MATVTEATPEIWNTTAGNKTTASFTPVLDDLLVAVCGTSGVAGGTTAVTDSLSGSWTLINPPGQVQAAANVLIGIWVRTTLVPASAMTVTATQASSTGGGLNVFRISGMSLTGSSAVRSQGSQANGTAATTPAPVLNNTPLTTNPIIIGLINNTNGTANQTVRTGYTESADLGYATPATGFATQFRSSGETSATLTFGGTTPSAFGVIAIEFDASAAAPAEGLRPPRVVLQAVKRSAL